jgi:1-deoxy-D-xylulose-5-phosphate reductoisomerase
MTLVVIGATGSIGRSTLSVARAHGIRVAALAARRGSPALHALVQEWRPELVAVADEEARQALMELGPLPPGCDVMTGEEGLVAAAVLPAADTVLVAVPGLSGLTPTMAALDAGKRVLTANKESLVAGGALLARPIAEGRIVSVDSEHAALGQLLASGGQGVVELILTASGGPFRDRPVESLATVTVAEAISHPTWRMGPKVSVDSATLMNKGLEVIEAHVLFGVPYDRISVVLHPESIVHALVRYEDGVLLAQLSSPDMVLPIQWALFGGERRPSPAPQLNLESLVLHFDRLPPASRRALSLAYEAGRMGGTRPAALSAANEVAVEAFLNGRLPFTGILPLVEETLNRLPERTSSPLTLDTLLAQDHAARALALSLVRQGGPAC